MSAVEVEAAVEQAMDAAAVIGNDTERFTQAESVSFWENLSLEAGVWARLIKGEMDAEG